MGVRIPPATPVIGGIMNVNVGSRWRSSDYKDFVVESVKILAGDTWVHYAKVDKFGMATDQKFSCLAGAFKVRFSPCVE
jgi:hypothetical protein